MSDQGDLIDPGRPAIPPTRHTARSRTRRGDPGTSYNAAARAMARLRRSQYDVLRLFSLYGPCHDEEMLERAWREDYAQTESGMRTRRSELVTLGFLMDTGKKAETKAGGAAIVWGIQPDPELTLRRIEEEDRRAAQEGGVMLEPPPVPPKEAAVVAATGWWQREFICFDTETTGPDPLTARIVQLALCVDLEGGLFTTADDVVCLVSDCGPIDPEAEAVHHISQARCEAEGRPLVHVLTEALMTLEVWAERGHPLVIFNAGYDWQLFFAECRRAGLTVPSIVQRMAIVDPLCLHKELEPTYYGQRKLRVLCARYGFDVEAWALEAVKGGLHDAAVDAKATGKLLRVMMARHAAELHRGLPELMDYQRTAYTNWRTRSMQYWAGKGRPRDIKPVDWLGP